MSDLLDDWKKALDDFQASVSKDLNEIRKHKADIQQMKTEIFTRLNAGKYIRDNQRIVLSAPEIVIGNVDISGDLSDKGGTVVVKGKNVMLDGVGENGSVTSRAATIIQSAVDPGIDGVEAVVRPRSAVISQAKSIVIQSNNSKDIFSQKPKVGDAGIVIHSDTTMQIDASLSAEKRKKEIEDRTTNLKSEKLKIEAKSKTSKANIESKILELKATIKPYDTLNESDVLTRTNHLALDAIQVKVAELTQAIYQESVTFIRTVSQLAEVNRRIDTLDKEKQTIKTGDDFKKNTTKATLSIASEHIDVVTKDGDDNFKENPEAGIRINSPRMEVTMQKEDGSLAEKSIFSVQVEKVDISTANPKVSDQSTELPGTGSVNIYSKTINMLAIDSELKDKKLTEKSLTKDGQITLRAEHLDFSATDTEGKATGAIDINAKTVAVKSMDVDKDKRTDQSMAKDSSMLLLAEKMYVGAKDKDNHSKYLQAQSDQLGLFAEQTLEAQQGDGKAVLQLADGDASVSGSKTQLYGETTINAKTEIKDELKAPKATIEHIEAKSSFKSSNISDGLPVPPTPASTKLSTKLKKEDAPKK